MGTISLAGVRCFWCFDFGFLIDLTEKRGRYV
jgi:hypothetical protein